MIGWLTGLLAPKFGEIVGKRIAVGLVVLLGVVAAILIWKAFIGGIIKRHDLEQDAEVVQNDAKADSATADERAVDQTRISQEASELKETVDEAKANGSDPRAAYYACVKQLQSARASGRPTPAC